MGSQGLTLKVGRGWGPFLGGWIRRSRGRAGRLRLQVTGLFRGSCTLLGRLCSPDSTVAVLASSRSGAGSRISRPKPQ